MYDWWPEVKACAEENGVRLWAWVHVSDIDTQEERDRHFSEWAKEGIVGIKPDFFDGEGQGRMQLYDDLYKDAAKYGLMLLVHGANKPTGEIRTWPNVYGREAIRGQEAGGITAEQYTMIPFIRAAIGPAEVTEEIRSKDYNKTTMGFQFALTALVEDGIHSMGSAPDVYRSIPEGMSYYKNYPKKWDETKLVDGAVGEQVSIARRTGSNWYVSGISVEPRTMQVPLACLDENKEYTVLLYRENGRRDVDMDIIPNVTNETVLQIEVLKGGGYALRAIPEDEVNSITSIVANPTEVTVEKGNLSDPVAITFSPSDAEFKDVAWSTADEAIATVSDSGVIRGVAKGETTVTVASVFDETVKAEIKVTVTPARYVLDEKTWSILNENENVMIKDTGSATITTESGVLGDGKWKNMFSMDVPEGDRDFTITAKMTGGLKANYQGGFITVFDKANPNGLSVAAGRRHHTGMLGGSHPQGFGVMSTASGRTTEFYCEDKDYGNDVYVKLEKTGNTFTSSYSYDGETWTVITNKGTSQTTTNANLAASANLCVGFYAGSGGGDTAIDITFSDFTYNGVKVPVAIDTQAQEEVDKTALNKAIATAEALKEADYTSESWKVLASAVKAAKDAAADEKATQQEVNDATAAIEAAVEALVKAIDTNAILKFDFSKTETVDNVTSVVGIANGEEVTATAQNVIFETDEDSNDIAVFPEGGDNAATGITYTPGDNDPMKSLAQGNGATIAMWVKTAQDTFSSTLFAYGSRQNADAGDLGASIQIIGRNNTSGDTVFYRNASGSTGGHKVAGVGNPYVKDTWQLVTFVENENGSGTLYIDGVERGTCKASDKTLLGFATDGNTPDHYYFGFLPYVSGTDTHFAGAMDSITVYNKAFTAEQVQSLYNERVKPEVDKTELNKAISDAEELKEADYTTDSWKALAAAVKAAKEVAANDNATQKEVENAKAAIEAAVDGLVAAGPEEPGMVLDAAWEVENPTDGNLVVNEDGSVTITTEGGTVDTAGGMKNILYYKLPNQTDYDFTVKVKGNFTANYQGAHLMIASGKNRANAVAVVRRYHGYLSGKYGTSMLMGVMQNGGSPNEYYEGAADIGNEFYLKLQKQNGRITGFYAAEYSDNKEDWNQIIDGDTAYVDKGNGLIDPENIYVAIAAANGGGNTPTEITFSDLRVGGEPVPFSTNSGALKSTVLHGEAKMDVAATQTLSLTGTDYDGNTITKFDSVVYTSSDEEVATVSKDGVVTGVHNGNVVITAAATVGGVTKTADLAIQVGEIVAEKTWKLSSPDGNTKMTVEMMTGGVLRYRAEQNKVENIGTSPLGLVTSLGDFSKGLVFKKASEVKEINESYKVLSGKSDEYTDHCNEQTLTFTVKNNDSVEFDLVIRAYDDGTAYRYAVRTDGEKEIRISDEVSGLQLPKEADVYWMNYTSATWNYESQYQVTTTEGLAVDATPSMPFLYGKDGVWTLFSEADLNGSYCGSMFTVKENGMLDVSFAKQQTKDVVTTTPFKSPWRAAITGTPADIVENTMIENLSTPADYET
ncbi:glycoside hydrolase family 97 N-terminal domain-containing protein, partial [Robinsoniella peoriensis]|uniref:glycoside hydrolase family 97 N-terminal domain-containing protein n=1 Tax=Robinsoniella peoriensis TaxID=180332 RepID=UPI0005C7CB17